jgi:hypothetical protein
MVRAYSIATPYYQVCGVKGDVFDVYNKKQNAIKKAINLAVEYPGVDFQVVKKVFQKKAVVFSVKIDTKFDFSDLQHVYDSLIKAYQKKLDKTKFWRSSDEYDE